jgi:thiosulfate dehydrogenase (quinone) large subunit
MTAMTPPRAETHVPVVRLDRAPARSNDAAPSEEATPSVSVPAAVPVLRITMGLLFLWAFFDKLFGLGFSTAGSNGWIDGGSPTKGFLSHVAVGPLEGTLHDWAGQAWADWLFMLGLLGIGLALTFGIAMRIAAGATVVMMALMWIAEWPLARHTSAGEASGSTNPLIDYHVIYALVALTMASLPAAGDRWGLGRQWRQLPVVRDHRWMQ